MHTTGEFVLQGGNTEFANRQKLLFDKLSDAEQECNKNKMSIDSTDTPVDVNQSNRSQISRVGLKRSIEMRRFLGKESIFKRPEGPAPRALNKSIPDFHKNPHKWKKYSLDDVSNDDMTEESNTRAALSFLKELKARRSLEKSEKMDVKESGSSQKEQRKIIFKSKKLKTEVKFKKPEEDTENVNNAPVIVEIEDKPIFRSSKVIMPEYVIGQKQKKKNKREKHFVKIDRSKQMKLDHLEATDEEEEEG